MEQRLHRIQVKFTEGGETMKTRISFMVSVVLALFVFAGTTLAETYSQNQTRSRNQNQNQNRRVKQSLKCLLVLNAAEVTFTGTVSDVGTFEGLKIDTEDKTLGEEGIITVYGLGPVSFWEAQDVDRPVIGDPISVDVKKIVFSDLTFKYILMSLTYTEPEIDVTIQLRSDVTGCPLWRP
jgi:hypothetical protein